MKILNGLVFNGKDKFEKRDVFIENQLFSVSSTGEEINASDCYVVPGFIDVHTHGAMGYDFSDGNSKAMDVISSFFAQKGTTGFLATTMTLSEETLTKAVKVIGDFVPSDTQSQCLGVHLEGPFLNEKKKGAQSSDNLMKPSIDMFDRLQKASSDKIKLITIAPEIEGGMDFIKATKHKCCVSLGHSNSNYETAKQAFDCGANHATHLYNAMNGIHHRDPNIIGACFDSHSYAELICDGIHIHPTVIRMTQKMFGDKMLLVSDSIRCTGLEDGQYTLGGQEVFVKDGKSVLADGTIAGSTVCLHDSLLRAVKFGLSVEEAIYAVTVAPAKSIGLEDEVGKIEINRTANCVILNKDLSIKQVIIKGNKIF